MTTIEVLDDLNSQIQNHLNNYEHIGILNREQLLEIARLAETIQTQANLAIKYLD